jgi:hypothetical protein
MQRKHVLLRPALTTTNRIDGRVTTSQIASASRASLLFDFIAGLAAFIIASRR